MGERGSRPTPQPPPPPLGQPGWTQWWVRDFSGCRRLGPSEAGRERAGGSAPPRIQPRCVGAAGRSAAPHASPGASDSLKINLLQSFPSPPGVWLCSHRVHNVPGTSRPPQQQLGRSRSMGRRTLPGVAIPEAGKFPWLHFSPSHQAARTG